MRILITGAAGMIGSHAAEFYAQGGHQVIAFDNLMRSTLFKSKHPSVEYNWQYLARYPNVERIVADARRETDVKKALGNGVDAILHAAGQPGVFYSLENPLEDFSINAQGTLNVLECARQVCPQARIVYCSTNKVYGTAVERVPLQERETRYEFEGALKAIPETFDIDRVGHTPYGASKYVGDLYMQEYAYAYGMKTAVFRMSCIYGTRQFGFEDQGWVAWFAIRCLKNQPLTIYGDGKQVRDVLFVSDLIRAYDSFLQSDRPSGVYNLGGGPGQTLSLVELLTHLKAAGLSLSSVSYAPWRLFDQKVYVSDIARAQQALGWSPTVGVREGVQQLVAWVRQNAALFA